MIAKLLAPRIGKNVIVENRPGASGYIGASAVARGPKDGSVLLCTSSSMITAAATKSNVPIDILKDLTPVSILSESPLLIIVSVQSKIRTPADLVAAARANPDTITNGTPGLGTIAHLTGELLNKAANIEIKNVPYTGGSPALVDLLGGRIDINIVSNSQTAGYVADGKVRPVAITWAKPSPDFPGVPTMASAVPGFEVVQWQAVWAPAGTPPAIVDRLNRELNEIVKTPEFAALVHEDGGIAQSATPAQAATRVRESYQMWRELAKAKNIIVD
ncbi:MAG TPA: tripartite tricarboxylate transporter substrate-binding protein [Casimicrobiaceae bacterium]|nr:tripartite tricarboxylate transporter substrate-binding protein [Casimicrobiaceae bacterium]